MIVFLVDTSQQPMKFESRKKRTCHNFKANVKCGFKFTIITGKNFLDVIYTTSRWGTKTIKTNEVTLAISTETSYEVIETKQSYYPNRKKGAMIFFLQKKSPQMQFSHQHIP